MGGRYEIVGRIGSGGMADVYKARDGKLNRFVAVKVMKPEFNNNVSFVSKFRREAQAAAGLANPNIVNVFDVGEDNGVYYIVMELVEGITLKEYIEKKGKLTVREATSIAIQVCMGLAAAHSHGIVHRDVKPQNIIISTNGKVKVTDFGIARAASSNTISANAMGSVHYSSPEQVRGGYSDAKSDIYSLGITMYEMVTGRVPFDGDTTVAIAIKHLQDEIEPPSKYTPDLPYSLEQIIYKCTQKSVERRYNSVDEVIEDLKKSILDPNGHFVQLTPLSNHAQTIMISPAELETIRKAADEGSGASNPVYSTKNEARRGEVEEDPDEEPFDEDEDADYEEDEKYKEPKKKSGKKKNKKDYDDDDDDGGSTGLEKAMTIGGFIIGAVIICILIYFIGRAAGLFNFGDKDSSSSSAIESSVESSEESSESESVAQVTVPDIIGLTEQEAQTVLSQSGLGIKYQGEAASDSVPSGNVCAQDPEPGSTVDAGTTINYYRSSGAAEVPLPNVTGFSLTEAQSQLAASGFTNIKIEQGLSNDTPINSIISMSPEGGSVISTSVEITLTVCIGAEEATPTPTPEVTEEPEPEPTEIPEGDILVESYTGLNEAQAKSVLESMGLTVVLEDGESEDVGYGDVMSQSIEPGTKVAAGTQITLEINRLGEPDSTETTEESSQEAVAETASSVWTTNQRLGAPSNYTGGAYRLTLEQGGTKNTLSEGRSLNFPYTLSVQGQTGLSEGTVYLYENVNGNYVMRANWTVPFAAA